MDQPVSINQLDRLDRKAIQEIAGWYLTEWQIPEATTIERLTNQSEDDIVSHFVASVDGCTVATGGLHKKVGILKVYPGMREFGPWVAVLYTIPHFRKRGIGEQLMARIEKAAREAGFKKIYLYTYTAESLYRKCGWEVIERVPYKGHACALMEKSM